MISTYLCASDQNSEARFQECLKNSKCAGPGEGGSVLTVETQVLEVAVGKVVLHDGHEGGHLTEEQHLVVGGSQLGQDAIQQLKLPGGAVQVGSEGRTTARPVGDTWFTRLGAAGRAR